MGDIQSALLKNLSCTRGRSRLAKPLELLKILQTLSCLLALLHPGQPANRASIPSPPQRKAKQAGERPLRILLAYVTCSASQRSSVARAGLGNSSANSIQSP